jgi:hypothetical protein
MKMCGGMEVQLQAFQPSAVSFTQIGQETKADLDKVAKEKNVCTR